MRKDSKVRINRLAIILMVFVMALIFCGGTSVVAAANADDNAGISMDIASVEVLNHPEFQAIYRQSLYQGDEAVGENPDKWYTTYETINLNDERLFTFEVDIPADKAAVVGEDPDAFLETLKLQYGGHDLSEWANVKSSRGSANTLRDPKGTPYLIQKDKSIVANEDGSYTIKITMETACPWNPNSTFGRVNIPFEGYNANRQLYAFSNGQSSDNRWWWQSTPGGKGMGFYPMAVMAGENELASMDVEIQQYDGANSWIQKNEFAQSLVKAITGSEVPKSAFAEKKTGLMASGYVAMDEDGKFVKGDRSTDVYVEVSILGYGLTDNEAEGNAEFNNYARFNAIWNIVVAQDEDKVDTYLNETKPTMNTDPDQLINKYKDAKDEDIDMINVFYQTNVHPDEISGIDHTIQFIKDLIDGGKEGKKIDYYTWKEEDMNLRYRDPAEGYEKSEAGHVVKDGYTGRFLDTDARTKAVFDTQEALDKFIFVNNITSNPDGQAGMRRTNRYAFDLNRDAVFSTMPETIALMKDIMKWDPLIENEWHGYVQNMLIEPCTAPHDPAFDYDLLANNMRNLTYAAGYAVTANTGYDNFLIPWDHYDGGDWDDGGTIYSPMFAELLGTFGYTIEFPHANSDSFDAGLVIDYAMVNEALHGTTDVYEGNRLNGALKDVDGNMRDSHSVDVIDKSMRKNTILAKLETKKRGIENVDSMASDKYFIDKKNGEDVVVGRARPKDADGNTLSFFPDYIVIPYGDLQYNFAEGIKAINQMIDWGIKVEITTEDVEYDGDTIEAGSYLLDMRQANRNVIFEVMSKGYDATGFASMYADIYCNLPDVRGFDSIQIYGKGLFDGKTEVMDSKIQKKADISGVADEYVCFKSQSTDAVRFVNLLLSGKSSGGSTAAKGDVWMLKADVEDVGSASDYIIRTKDLGKLKKLKDAPVIGLNGCEIEGHYISELPEEAVQLVEPIIQWNSTRTTQTGGPLWYLLDDYLGFASLAPDQYNGSTQLREGANVIIANNVNQNNFQNSWAEAVKNGAGVIFIRNAAGLGKLGVKAPTSTNTFSDVAINGTYNVDDSLYTANYADTSTYYARGYAYTNLPERSKILFQSEENGEDAFIGGFQNTKGLKDVFGNKVTIFSTILDGEDFAKPVNAVVFGQYMDYRSHYQKLLPMLATAIYAGAAGIVDDAEAPEIGEIVKDGKNFTVTAEEAASGIGLASLEVYRVKGDKDILIAESDEAELTFTTEVEEDTTLKVVASDKLGNTAECTFVYDGEGGFIDQETAEEEAEAADQEAADEAEAAIDALPDADKITADDEKAVEAARAAYEALTPAQKEKVSPEAVAALEAAEKAVADAKAADAADKEAADKAAAAIAALPAADAITAADEEAVAAARAAYDALTPAQKAKVSPDAVAALEAAEKAVADAKGKDGAADAKVTGLKVKSKARKFTVSWKAAEGVTGYQVQFKLKSAKKWKNLKAATTKTSVKSKKLKKGKKYQFRVRPYTEVNGEKVYGKWATKAKKCS